MRLEVGQVVTVKDLDLRRRQISNGAPLEPEGASGANVSNERARYEHALNMSILPHALSGEVFGHVSNHATRSNRDLTLCL